MKKVFKKLQIVKKLLDGNLFIGKIYRKLLILHKLVQKRKDILEKKAFSLPLQNSPYKSNGLKKYKNM